MELDKKLNVLYQVCVFRADRKTKMAALVTDWLRHFDFSSERISTKLDRKQEHNCNILYQVCVFWWIKASDWLRNLRLLLWTEFNGNLTESKISISSQYQVLWGFFRADRKTKMVDLASDWPTFSTSSLKHLNGNQRILTGSKISPFLTRFMVFFFGRIRWASWPLIRWDIFDFFSATTERNLTKLDRKQDLYILYQVRVFRANQKTKMATLASDWPRHFRLPWWTEFNETDRKQNLNVLFKFCVFLADRKTKFAAMASDWQIHFRLILWNCWTEFNESWQETRSQHPLPISCFSSLLETKKAALVPISPRHFRHLWNSWTEFNKTR